MLFRSIALLVAIVTARLLTPTDFGYIGALALFTILSNTLVESGFTAALVRRQNNTNADYCAAFYVNITLSIIFYLLLYFFAPTIAHYFKMPELVALSRFLFIAIIINSFGIIQTIILTKELRFKPMSMANLIAVTLSGIITITLAIKGYGYWAIAWQQITQVLFRVLILWIVSKWRPTSKPNFTVIKELFAFSSFLLVTSVITNSMRYVYNFFIGPRYTSAQLGYYAQAYKFHQIPATVISSTLTGVAYPVIASLNDDKGRQMLYLRKIIRIAAFITFPVMIGLYLMAHNIFAVVLSEKWIPAVPYFQTLMIAAMIMPFINLSLNTITAIGRPRLNFVLEMTRNALMLIFLFIMNSSINMLLYGFVISTVMAYIINIITLSRVTSYTILQHLKDIMPYLLISIIMAAVILLFRHFVTLSMALQLIIEITIGIITYLSISILLGSKIVQDIKALLLKKNY